MYKYTTQFPSSNIEKIGVIRETAHRVIFIDWKGKERTENKVGKYTMWHNTLHDAKRHLIDNYLSAIKKAEETIEHSRRLIEKVASIEIF